MEENKKLGQEPAFGFGYEKKHSYLNQPYLDQPGNYRTPEKELGMSRRFYAACAAMQGLIASTANENSFPNPKDIAEISFKFADELLKQENL